jgi:hypothetical protein
VAILTGLFLADLGVGPGKSDNYRLTDPWVSTHTNLAGYIPTRPFFSGYRVFTQVFSGFSCLIRQF